MLMFSGSPRRHIFGLWDIIPPITTVRGPLQIQNSLPCICPLDSEKLPFRLKKKQQNVSN